MAAILHRQGSARQVLFGRCRSASASFDVLTEGREDGASQTESTEGPAGADRRTKSGRDVAAVHALNAIHSANVSPFTVYALTPHSRMVTIGHCPSLYPAQAH